MDSEQLIKALELVRAGKKDQAKEILDRVLEEEPQNESAFLLYVDTVMANDINRVEALRQFITLNPRSPQIRAALEEIEKRLPNHLHPKPAKAPAEPPPALPAQPEFPQTSAYFTEQPANVTTRFPPGALQRMMARSAVALAGVILIAFLLLPIWNQDNFFIFIADRFSTLATQRAEQLEAVGSPTPPSNSILFARLNTICLQSDDLPGAYRVSREHIGIESERLKSYEREGLAAFYGNEWTAPSQPNLTCDLMVYDHLNAALLAFASIKLAYSSGSRVDLASVGDESVGNLVAGAQFVYNYAYRQGRAIVKLTSFGSDRAMTLEALRSALPPIERRMRQYSTR